MVWGMVDCSKRASLSATRRSASTRRVSSRQITVRQLGSPSASRWRVQARRTWTVPSALGHTWVRAPLVVPPAASSTAAAGGLGVLGRRGEVVQVAADEVLAGSPEQLGQGVVDLEQLAVEAEDHHRDGRAEERNV